MNIDLFKYNTRDNSIRKKLIEDNKRIEKMSKNDYAEFGYDYFDNEKDGIGYGGYYYDGRFNNIAKDIIKHYDLHPNSKILEIGCAKGFLLYEFYIHGMDIEGIDKSEYAVNNCISEIKHKISIYDVEKGLPYPDNAFDLIIAKESLPHINNDKLAFVIKEIIRCSKNKIFFEIQIANSLKEKEYMKLWDITHKSIYTENEWINIFNNCNYQGDYHFKILINENL